MTSLGDGEGVPRVRGPVATHLRRLWRRRRFVAALAAVLVVSVALLQASFVPALDRYAEILVNLGASFLGVVATVLVLEPLIERSRTPEEVIHSEFPYKMFLTGVDTAAYHLRILGAWPYVMDHPWRARFLDGLRAAAERGVRIQILVLDPDSKAAEQRSRDLDNQFDVARVISEVLQEFWRLRAGLPDRVAAHLEIRVYSLLPPARMYRWDARAISSFFPMGNWVGSDIKHYETNMSSRLAQFVDEQFELIWHDVDTVSLDEYFRLSLDLAVPDFGFLSTSQEYVVHDGVLYVAAREIVEELYRLQTADPLLRLCSRVRGFDRGEDRLAMEVIPQSRAPRVRDLFRRKYGPASPLDGGGSLLALATRPRAGQP
ncbi:hypothetical protein [Rhizomonospora bruguierae]|uniref:hypothetical protein n=1 Tax=Rhizomonospora bruguierae TaxID=1581705 RepID=UPI001BCAA762|nr:hypothetical protein [Micromonospora sp. NBRC 107566]